MWEPQVDNGSESEEVRILWDFQIQTDRHLEHNIPDLVVMKRRKVWIIDIATPGDARV